MKPDPAMNMRHLVLFFTFDVSLLDWRSTGLFSREVRLYQALAERGWQTTFVTYGGAEDAQIARELAPIEVIALYDRMRCPPSILLRLLLSPLAVWKARHALRRADLVKTNQIWGGWNAIFAKWLFGTAVLARGGYESYTFALRQGVSRPRLFLTRMCARLTYRSSDMISMTTTEDKRFIERTFRLKSAKIDVRGNWVDTDVFSPMKDTEQKNKVLFVGRFNEQKNLFALIEAISGTGLDLDLIGWGNLEEELRAYAAKIGATVNFLGKLANDDLPQMMCRYPVFALTSSYEGNPKTLIEAMACGRAVLGTRVPGIQTLIEDGVSGLLCDPDAASIRQGLMRLAGDADLRRRLGAAARAQMLANNGLDSYLEHELGLYDNVTGRVSPARLAV